jgi:hypothetical protein
MRKFAAVIGASCVGLALALSVGGLCAALFEPPAPSRILSAEIRAETMRLQIEIARARAETAQIVAETEALRAAHPLLETTYSGSGTWQVSASTGMVTTYTANGGYVLASTNVPVQTQAALQQMPTFTMSCNADGCRANGYTGDMDDAKALLEKIANRQMRVEVRVDQNCHPRLEVIEPKPKEDLVAQAQ